jgi:hypothetical protein
MPIERLNDEKNRFIHDMKNMGESHISYVNFDDKEDRDTILL